MTIIQNQLINLIKSNGPISVESLMEIAMYDKHQGYYIKNQPIIGQKGDFITSPEISQLFGETICICLMNMWEMLGKPNEIDLVELGPGTGTLMQDILRMSKKNPDFYNSINSINFIETNIGLKEIQRKNLGNSDKTLRWLDNIEEFSSEIPSFFVANEFFDALPIRQYTKKDKKWYEIIVNFTAQEELFFDYRPLIENEIIFDEIEYGLIEDGDIIETANMANKIFRTMCDQLASRKGGAIIIDYGYKRKEGIRENKYKSSLQAVKSHKYHPILEDIGDADISSMVEFSSLMKIAEMRQPKKIEYLTQRDFLKKYGIEEIMLNICKNATQEQIDGIISGYERLTHPAKMGSIFKSLELIF